MSQEYRYTLNGKLRQDKGKGASRRLRREGWVPAVVYGGEGGAVSIAIKQDELVRYAKFDSFYSQIINLKVEGEEDSEVLVRDVQHHAYKPLYQHFDFQRVVRGQDVFATVGLHFLNEDAAVGVKEEGGVMTRYLTAVEIVCRPRYLPEYIEVDVADLKLGDTLHLSDLVMPEGVSLQQEDDLEITPVITISHPRTESETSDEDEDGESEESASEDNSAEGDKADNE